jgi:hypothetical protein
MRYTVDPLDYPDDDVPFDDPTVVEVHGPDETITPVRDYAGRVVGGSVGGNVGRARLRLLADSEVLERIAPLCQALQELSFHMTANHTVEYADGREPSSAEEEAEIRTNLEFESLLAHALLAVEVVTGSG